MPLCVTTVADDAHFHEYNASHWTPVDTANPLGESPRSILVHAGDISAAVHDGNELARAIEALNRHAQRFEHVVFVPGNHDNCFRGAYELFGSEAALGRNGGAVHDHDTAAHRAAQDLVRTALGADVSLAANVHVLVAGGVRIDGWCFYGLALQRATSHHKIGGRNCAFVVEPRVHHVALEQVPDDEPQLCVVSHVPPYENGDLCRGIRGPCQRTGCPSLRERLLRVAPALVVAGHVHSDGGMRSARNDKMRWVNAAVNEGCFGCDRFHDPRSLWDEAHARDARCMVKDVHQLRLHDEEDVECRRYRSTRTVDGLCADDDVDWTDWTWLRGGEPERRKKRQREAAEAERGAKRARGTSTS